MNSCRRDATVLLALVGAFTACASASCGGHESATAAASSGGGFASGGGGASTGDTTSTGAAPSCMSGELLCGGACVDENQDRLHCGSCGFRCAADETCCEGACSADCSMTITSLSPSSGPLSGGSWVTVQGNGFSPAARVYFGKSRAPARLVDGHTLLVKTPPGLAATVDVAVSQGSLRATRGAAFTYAAYGLAGTWKERKMSHPRGNWPGISVLQDGRVLISGGVEDSTGASAEDTADLFDPATGMTSATAGKMSSPRWAHASVTLLTGKVLVLGTWDKSYASPTPIADLFDPTTTLFAPTAMPPEVEHLYPHAVLLADGRVLIVSWASDAPEIYDPETDSFSWVKDAPNCNGYRPVRLLDGRVLLVHGGGAPTYLFDPDTATFSPAGTGPLADRGDVHTLPDGRVIYLGGSLSDPNGEVPTDRIEIFDSPTSGFQKVLFHFITPREHTLTTALAGDGSLLVIGGEVGTEPLGTDCASANVMTTQAVERIDPVSTKVSAFEALPEKNYLMSPATLLSGSIVAAGGAPCGGAAAYRHFYFLHGAPPK